MPTPEVIETRRTFGLFANIITFAMVLAAAAVLLGLFLGGGRAVIRMLQGKPAATEAEFLSLHLAPQKNPTPAFSQNRGCRRALSLSTALSEPDAVQQKERAFSTALLPVKIKKERRRSSVGRAADS